MENLKAIIVFLLFWSIVIWCARIIKRKRDKRMMEFSEELPEMELHFALFGGRKCVLERSLCGA